MNLPSNFRSGCELTLPAWVMPFLADWSGLLDTAPARMALWTARFMARRKLIRCRS